MGQIQVDKAVSCLPLEFRGSDPVRVPLVV